jgi:hypothetical protein
MTLLRTLAVVAVAAWLGIIAFLLVSNGRRRGLFKTNRPRDRRPGRDGSAAALIHRGGGWR